MGQALSVNDMRSAQRTPFYWVNGDTGSQNAIISGPAIIFGIYLTGGTGGVATVTLNNALTTGGGGTTFVVSVPANGNAVLNFEPQGHRFDTGGSIVVGANANSAEVTYKLE